MVFEGRKLDDDETVSSAGLLSGSGQETRVHVWKCGCGSFARSDFLAFSPDMNPDFDQARQIIVIAWFLFVRSHSCGAGTRADSACRGFCTCCGRPASRRSCPCCSSCSNSRRHSSSTDRGRCRRHLGSHGHVILQAFERICDAAVRWA